MQGIVTFTGRTFYPLSPRAEDIDIEDIAHALAMKCRFSGHTQVFYSVAEHSVLVSKLVPEKYALAGLLHDAAEAYLADVAGPIKSAFQKFQEAEMRLMDVIEDKFGIVETDESYECIKTADITALEMEKATVMRRDFYRSKLGIWGYDWKTAKELFLERFNELTKGRPPVPCVSANPYPWFGLTGYESPQLPFPNPLCVPHPVSEALIDSVHHYNITTQEPYVDSDSVRFHRAFGPGTC